MQDNVSVRTEGEFRRLALEKLELWQEANARKSDVYVDMENLAHSISEIGLQVPLVVMEQIPNEKYLVISGQRRLQACRMVNYSPVPCIVFKNVTLEQAKIMSLSENLHRRAMNADDISDACDYLYKQWGDLSEVARRLGVSVPTVRKYLGYKNVPEQIKDLVREGRITASQAILIYTQFLDPKRQIEVAQELASIQQRADKSKFFQAVKEARPTDDVPKIRERAKRLAEMKSFTILLPPKTSRAVEKVALEMTVEPEYIIAQIVEHWVEERAARGLPLIE
jgi:ParB/RepB/Spo0J family partition protein